MKLRGRERLLSFGLLHDIQRIEIMAKSIEPNLQLLSHSSLLFMDQSPWPYEPPKQTSWQPYHAYDPVQPLSMHHYPPHHLPMVHKILPINVISQQHFYTYVSQWDVVQLYFQFV